MQIGTEQIVRLLKTEYELNSMKLNNFRRLSIDSLKTMHVQLCGLDKHIVDSLGTFNSPITLDGSHYEMKLWLIHQHVMIHVTGDV